MILSRKINTNLVEIYILKLIILYKTSTKIKNNIINMQSRLNKFCKGDVVFIKQ